MRIGLLISKVLLSPPPNQYWYHRRRNFTQKILDKKHLKKVLIKLPHSIHLLVVEVNLPKPGLFSRMTISKGRNENLFIHIWKNIRLWRFLGTAIGSNTFHSFTLTKPNNNRRLVQRNMYWRLEEEITLHNLCSIYIWSRIVLDVLYDDDSKLVYLSRKLAGTENKDREIWI